MCVFRAAVHVPKERLGSRLRLDAEQRLAEVFAVESDARRIRDTGDLRERWKQIGRPHHGLRIGATGRYVACPPSDERLANSAFEYIAFPAAKRAVRAELVSVRCGPRRCRP